NVPNHVQAPERRHEPRGRGASFLLDRRRSLRDVLQAAVRNPRRLLARVLRRADERRLHQRLASGWSTALFLDEPVPAGGLVRRRCVSRAGPGNTGADRALRRSLRTKAPDERELAAGPRTKEKGASEETPASTPT